jgi:hypothetical protein
MITNQTFINELLPANEYNNCTFIDCYFEHGLITLNNCDIRLTQASKLLQALLKKVSENGKN